MLYISFLFKDKIVFIYTFSKKTGIYNIQTYIRTKHICIIEFINLEKNIDVS